MNKTKILFMIILSITSSLFVIWYVSKPDIPWLKGKWISRSRVDFIITDEKYFDRDMLLFDLDNLPISQDISFNNITVTTDDGITQIAHTVTSYAPEQISKALLVKNPNNTQNKTIYIYFGEELRENMLLEEAEINEETTILPHKYFADNGASSALQLIINPSAITYQDKTYITYQGDDFDIFIVAYDHKKNLWSDISFVADSPMVNDHHGAPILYIDEDGYLYVFFGCHGYAMEFVKSSAPASIDNWIEMPNVTDKATYPQVFERADGAIEVFYRAGTHKMDWISSVSLDKGETWEKSTPVIDGEIPLDAWYARFVQDENKRMHVTFLWKDDANIFKQPTAEYNHRYNIYYLSRNEDGIWRNISGEEVTSPIKKVEADEKALVYNSEDRMEQTNTASMAIDKNGKPHLIFLTGPFGRANYKYATWENKEWTVEDIGLRTNDMFDGNYLVHTENGLRAALIVNNSDNTNRGGDIQLWSRSEQSSLWNYERTVRADSGVLIHPPKFVSYHDNDDLLLYSDFSMNFEFYDHKLYLMRDGEHLGRSYLFNINDPEYR